MKRTKLLSLIGAVVLSAAVALPAAAGMRKVVVAADAEYPPFNYKNDAGEIVGFDVDVTHAACAAAKLDCSFVAQAWDGLIPGLLVGKYDAISASMIAVRKSISAASFT